jgi:hypothetical protein
MYRWLSSVLDWVLAMRSGLVLMWETKLVTELD